MTEPVFVSARVATCLASIAAAGAGLSYLFVDSFVQRFTAQFGFRGDVQALLDFIAMLGHGFFCAFVVITVFCLDPAKRSMVPLIALAPTLAGGVSILLKHLIPRPRPAIVAGWEARVSDSVFNRECFQSFPSGHTTTAFALATSLAMVYPQGQAYFFTLAALVGLQRVITQAHYPSDVFAGALIGILVASLLGAVVHKLSTKTDS